MSRFETIRVAKYLSLGVAITCGLLLFQNCSGEEANKVSSSSTTPSPSPDQPAQFDESILRVPNSLVTNAALPTVTGNTLVYVLAGQSNMEGVVPASQIRADERVIPANVAYYIQTERQSAFGQNGKFGPEIGIAYTLATAYPNRQIVLIKSALGGTSLRRWVLGAINNSGAAIGGSGDLFVTLKNSVTGVIARDFANQSPRINGFFWMQGESDADEFGELGLKYTENMQKFFNQVSSQLPLASDFRFVMGRIYQYRTSTMLDWGMTYQQIRWLEHFVAIRRAQSNLPTSFNTRIVSTDELSMQDFWHFDAWSSLSLGKCFGQAYLVDTKFLGCTRSTGINTAYPADALSDDRVTKIRNDLTASYRRILKREPDDEGLRYWTSEIYRGRTTLPAVEAVITNSLPSCAAQSLASAIQGQCHFGFACVSQAAAAAEIASRRTAYSSCGSEAPRTHQDCLNAFGTARGYIATCPLMRTGEVLTQNGSTLTGRVADLYKIYRLRNPDTDGLNYWVNRIQSGQGTEAELRSALQ